MLVLTSAQTVRHAIDNRLTVLPADVLERYAALIDTEPIAWIFVIQPGDTAEAVQSVRRQPFSEFEFIDHLGEWFEAVTIISDDGFGHVIFVPDRADIDAELLETCRLNAA